MTIRDLDPSGELGRLFFHVQTKNVHAQEATPLQQTNPRHSSVDAVDLSTLAQEIRDYSSRASQVPELRMDKIQRIQQDLESGGELATSGQLAEALTRETILNSLGA
jgi:hypothetical protein